MAKFATKPSNVTAPIVTTGRTATYEGGFGFERDAQSELFLLAVSNMVSENTFYEDGKSRDDRYVALIHQVTKTDPGWVRGMVPFLRDEMHMRSASLVMAAEYARAGGADARAVVRAALKRPDEPGEMVAYFYSTYGRKLPAAVKRGVADAVVRLYTERNAVKWDGTNRPWRFADVIEAVHPKPATEDQSTLFHYLLDGRHHHAEAIPEALTVVAADASLRALPEGDRRANLGRIEDAAWSWERLAGWLPGGMDREAWEAVIPQMGYMALLRNLRNFDQAGVSDDMAAAVMAKLADPDEVARSRQFPIRFFSAYREIGSLRWAYALEQAVDLSLANVPVLPGKTLVMVDLSGSMWAPISGRSQRERWEIAALFGVALAKRAENPRLIAYGSDAMDVTATLIHQPLLKAVEQLNHNMGGTNTFSALRASYADHDRVVILTDEQAHDAGGPMPDVPVFTFNLAGYKPAHGPSGGHGRYTFGGLTDAGFQLIPMIEASRSGRWPWEQDAA